MEQKLSEIINLVNAKDFTYKSKSLELIETLKETEKKKETSEIQLTAILLNFLIGNYSLYGFNFNLISKETKEAIEKLIAVGLNSIPIWCKPRNVLSVGEGFRIDLARRIKNNCVIDEFTSTVDRNVALSCAKSIGKYIRKKNLKRCVFVSCHKDFIDVLKPDYIVDLDDEKLYDSRRLLLQDNLFYKSMKSKTKEKFGTYLGNITI